MQTAAGARAEAERLKRLAAQRGTLEPDAEVPTVAAYVEGDFARLVMVRFKASTREGYQQLLDAPEHGLVALLGRKRLDASGAADARVVEADALARKAKPRFATRSCACARCSVAPSSWACFRACPGCRSSPPSRRSSRRLPRSPWSCRRSRRPRGGSASLSRSPRSPAYGVAK